jgi:BirA family transcriptional regulator, biotin operon repressor / biotin---[acetyl-CoA-carboxylase] ligase
MSSRDLFLDDLKADDLRAALDDPHIGNRIVVVEETTSTNDLVWQMAQEGSGDGLVVFAERQTAGRGQRGNRWESAPHQGLWFSILLRPKIGPAESARLTTWATQTVAATVEEALGINAAIKPPNDVYAGDRKIAGVLVEMRVEKTGDYLAIAGIGVNVNQSAGDFSDELCERAGSLAMAVGKRIDRPEFAIALLRDLDQSYCALFVP